MPFFIAACVIAAALAVVFGRPALQKARTEREAREREERRLSDVFMAEQVGYFNALGVRTVDAQMSPRLSDIGTLHVTHAKAHRWQSDDDGSWHSQPILCDHGCGTHIVFLDEVAPAGKGQGAAWTRMGNYCAKCGAWKGSSEQQAGPLIRLKKGVTNLYDALGDRKGTSPEDEWQRLGSEETDLEARLNGVRARRLVLAERLGKPMGAPFRPQLVAGGKES